MKRLNIILVFALLLMLSCGKRSSEVDLTSNKSDSATVDSVSQLRTSIDTMLVKQEKTRNISLDSAGILISNFLNETSFLQGVAQTRAIGGTFIANQFDFNTSPNFTEGALMWFCYNADDSNLPVFFLSTQKVPNISTFPTFPLTTSPLITPKPGNVFTYKLSDGIDKASVIRYLKQSIKVPDPISSNVPLDRTKAIHHIDEFSQWQNRYSAPEGGAFCDLAFSFFKNEPITSGHTVFPNGVTAFLNQKKSGVSPVYVRYYFGYEPKEINGKLHNKIRIILIAADIDGKNFVEPSSIILQKSVPPFE